MKFIVKEKPEIILCDNHLLVLYKPHGMLTQPSGTEKYSLEEFGKHFLKEKFEKKGNVFLEAVHRLDAPVSGLVLFARTSKALSRLNESLRERTWKKTYLAMVEGHFSKKEDILEDKISHGPFRAEAGDQECTLTYKVLEEDKRCSLLEIELQTGRYHQIRYQLSKRGHPIVGDRKYGSQIPFEKGIALSHVRLEIVHPVTHIRVRIGGNTQ
jgi:23S rRNA pseudouridine1911/1915/1917 synthase